jgi:membrane protease YdiL (CAAX protease family)
MIFTHRAKKQWPAGDRSPGYLPTSDFGRLLSVTTLRWIFVGSNGIRAGWRLCIYLALVIALTFGLGALVYFSTHWTPSNEKLISASAILWTDLLFLVPMLIAAYVMSRIEHRPMAEYGLPLYDAFRRHFWLGALAGFLSLTFVLAIVYAGHDLHVSLSTATLASIVFGGFAFAVAMIVAGLTEEFLYRGYSLATLTQGVGFWPAATLLSFGFALNHAFNAGESPLGLVQVYVFAITMCYTLRRTGSLWFAVGYHAAWNWAETFFFGVPDSGHVSESSLLNGILSGPAWFSGGSDGPEGSFLAIVVLIVLIPIVNRLAPNPAPRQPAHSTS